MSFRVADITSSSDFVSRINTQRGRLSVLQERIATGKRINRPSDDPSGSETVMNLRTSQKEIEQFQRAADTAGQKLTSTDDSLNNYQSILDRLRTLVTQGLSGTITQPAKNALAIEIESLRSRILNLANGKNGAEYVFGGTRQNVPPYDPATATPAATPTTVQYIQIEPGANAIAAGITADKVFGDATATIFADLTAVVNALRGTGNPAADQTTLENTSSRLGIYADLANNARAIVGATMNSTDIVKENLANSFLAFDERAAEIEDADYAETAVALTDADRALEAILQVAAKGRRSLMDFLG